MFLHLVEDPNDKRQYQTMVETRYPCHLISFVYRGSTMDKVVGGIVSNQKASLRLLIDSGAFTAYTTGKVITVREYGQWMFSFRKEWESKVKSLHFFNLDVIGSQEESNINLHRLEALGLNPLPVFTFDADIKHLIYYLENYEYIAFGGLVGKGSNLVTQWLDYCYKQVNQHYKQTGILRKTHLLGVTKPKMLERYPLYSCDSSNWVFCLKFGCGTAIGKTKLPRPSESPEALKLAIVTLKAEVEKYKKLQNDITNLWTKRGVIWDN